MVCAPDCQNPSIITKSLIDNSLPGAQKMSIHCYCKMQIISLLKEIFFEARFISFFNKIGLSHKAKHLFNCSILDLTMVPKRLIEFLNKVTNFTQKFLNKYSNALSHYKDSLIKQIDQDIILYNILNILTSGRNNLRLILKSNIQRAYSHQTLGPDVFDNCQHLKKYMQMLLTLPDWIDP